MKYNRSFTQSSSELQSAEDRAIFVRKDEYDFYKNTKLIHGISVSVVVSEGWKSSWLFDVDAEADEMLEPVSTESTSKRKGL